MEPASGSLDYPEYSSLVTVQATLCLILSLPSMVKGISVPGKTRFHSLGYPEYSSLVTVQATLLQGLSRNASSASFGHPEHCFLTVWTPKSLCQNLLKMTFLRR